MLVIRRESRAVICSIPRVLRIGMGGACQMHLCRGGVTFCKKLRAFVEFFCGLPQLLIRFLSAGRPRRSSIRCFKIFAYLEIVKLARIRRPQGLMSGGELCKSLVHAFCERRFFTPELIRMELFGKREVCILEFGRAALQIGRASCRERV